MDTHRLLVAVRTGVAAATIWGLVSAALTRALMRAITLITDGTPEFTWSGSILIAVVYIAAVLPGAIALACTARRWAGVLFGGGSPSSSTALSSSAWPRPPMRRA